MNVLMDSRTQEICWALIREARELIDWCRNNEAETPRDGIATAGKAEGRDMTERLEDACRDLTRKL